VDISFDAAKNARNIATRGISFEQAVDFEWDTALIVADTRKDYGESREFTAPALGNKPNLVTIAAILPANANGVLYKLGANSGGLTLFVEDGILCYEYNLFIIMRTKIRATQKLPVGKAKIEVETVYVEPKPGGSGERSTALYRKRLPRHWHRLGLSGFAGLSQKGAVQVHRHHRQSERQVHPAADEIGGRSSVFIARAKVRFIAVIRARHTSTWPCADR
jgi:uncharacterized DUF497 family protein